MLGDWCHLAWMACFLRRADKTVKERQGALYDAIMMSMVSIPVLAFAFYGDSYRAEWHNSSFVGTLGVRYLYKKII